MSDEEWEEAYHAAWRSYFSWEHMETVGRRHARLSPNGCKKALHFMNMFKMTYEIEGLHALEGGVFRRKRRRARRPSFRREPALTFYPKHVAGSAIKLVRYVRETRKLMALIGRILADPARRDYTDVSLQPPSPEDFETLGLFQETVGGAAAVAKKLKQDVLLEEVRVAHQPAA
jgi:hypothetical protein